MQSFQPNCMHIIANSNSVIVAESHMDDIPAKSVLNSTPSNEMYSTPTTISVEINPSYGVTRRKEDLVQSKAWKGDRQNASNRELGTIGLNAASIIVTLLFTSVFLVSIALSVTSYSRLASEQSQNLSQLNKTSSDIAAAQQTLCNIPSNVLQILTQLDTRIICRNEIQLQCGTGLWWQVASLNMSDRLQQCPSTWREYNTSGVRACGRPVNLAESCAVTGYFTGRQYSRVCGRLIGYQIGSPDGFHSETRDSSEIRLSLDGISITYGMQH